jgi:8-oxo-dGTP pyrophosphatase MutT (NUDIX family)
MADVELPDGRHLQHRVIRYPAPTAGTLLHNKRDSSVLLIWRHRFITGRWGWEIPAGLAEPGESPIVAAVRETAEESGYRPLDPRAVTVFNTSSGIMDETFHGFYSDKWEPAVPDAKSKIESERLSWVPVGDLDKLIDEGHVPHGHSLVTILMTLRLGLLSGRR